MRNELPHSSFDNRIADGDYATQMEFYMRDIINQKQLELDEAKEEYIQLLLTSDVHSPAVLRANMPPRNFGEWYEAFKKLNDPSGRAVSGVHEQAY